MPSPPPPASTVSISQVAAAAGVSIATVSRVLNGIANKASAETAARVWQAAEALGYRPGSVGRALRQKRSRLVAVLANNLANPAIAAIAASAETALREAGLVMVLCDTHDQPALQDEYLLEMRAQLACAIVLLGAVDSPQLHRGRDGEAMVFVNRAPPAGHGPFIGPVIGPVIGIDNRQAGIEVALWLRSCGVTHPGVLHASRASSATEARLQGFLSVAGEAALLATGPGGDHLRIGHGGIDALLDRPGAGPRGVFCTSDLIAYGAHRRLAELGLSVPGDIRLAGFDDNPLNDWLAPWLTSVRVPYDDFGPAIVGALQDPTQPRPLLAHRLVVRQGPR